MRHHGFNLDNVPQAHSVKTFLCGNPECKRYHVVLEDESGQPIAHFVPPDDFGEKLAAQQLANRQLRWPS